MIIMILILAPLTAIIALTLVDLTYGRRLRRKQVQVRRGLEMVARW